jgi:chitinase
LQLGLRRGYLRVMRKGKWALGFLMMAGAGFFAGGAAGRGASPEVVRRPIVLGYYPSWASNLSPEAIRFDRFTHICHAFATCDERGHVQTHGNLPSRDLTERAHAAGVKVLVSLGGMDSGARFQRVMSSPEAARRFVDETTQLALGNGYDGVDIDWEFPEGEEGREGMVHMARLFREAFILMKPDALITSAVSGAEWASRDLDAERLRPLLDLVAVMTYDVHGPWKDHAGPNAPLAADPRDREACRAQSVEGQMALWTDQKGWPRERLLVGIPCYGRGFLASGWYEPTEPDARPPHTYVAFRDVAGMLAQGWQRHWDTAVSEPYLTRAGDPEIISYDDEESARIKGRWAAEHGFGGIFFWEISQDFVDGDNALVRAAREGWGR